MSEQRALLVDDDDSWREILQEILEDSGFQVTVASTLEEAQVGARQASHQIAVVDLSLGGEDHRNQDGLLVLDAVGKADPKCQCILLTGFATVELAVSVITEGKAKTCLRKESFSRAEFRSLLNEASKTAPLAPETRSPAPQSFRGKALLVEDDAGWRELLRELLAEVGLAAVECTSFAEARGHLKNEDWLLAVLDLQLSSSVEKENQDGLKLLGVLRESEIPTVVVSGTSSTEVVEKVFEEKDILGFFEKQNFQRRAFLELLEGALQPSALDVLTERERETLELLAQGLTNQKIADALFISPNTVKRHLKAVFEKLGVNNRAAAAALVIRDSLE